MLPTINKRFLLKLVAVVVLLAGGLAVAHTVQSGRIPDALMAQADRAHEQAADDPKKGEAAVAYLRQYLEFRPTDVGAMEKLAEWLRERKKGGNQSDLLRLYDKILALDPSRHDTRREALKSSLFIRRFTDAEGHAAALTAQFPADAQLWLDLAYARRGLQKQTEARECYEAAKKADPKMSAAYQEYAEFLVNDLKLKDEAKKQLDEMVAALPGDAGAVAARGRFFAAMENEPAAVADAKAALKLDPTHADATLLLAEQLQKGRDIQGAADLFKRGIAEHPADARFVRGLAWLEVSRGNTGASVAALEAGMERVGEKDAFDLLVPLADLLLQMRDQEKAKGLIRKLEGLRPTDRQQQRTVKMQVLYLKGRSAMSDGRWADAIDLLTQLRGETGELLGLECQVNLLLSLCHQRTGDFEQEERTLKLLLGKDPHHAAARVTLGAAYQSAGRFDEAIAEYEQAARSRFATAGTRASLLKMKAAKLRVTNAGKKEWDDLDTQTRQLAPGFGGAEYAILRADLFAARRAPDRAIAALREEAMKRPTDGRLWAAYAAAAADYAGVPAGLSLLDEAQAMCGDRAELRLARAALYARDPARLRPIDPLAAQIDTWPESDQNKVLYGLVEVYDRLGDEAGVVRTFRRIAGRYPSDPAVWEGLFDRATREGDAAAAAEARGRLAKLEPEAGKSAALLTAWEVANGKQSAQAADAAAGLVKQFGPTPDRGDVCVALAKLKALTGDTPAAGSLFARAVRLDPVRFGPTQEYLAFLAEAGQDDQMAKLLGRLTQDYRWSGEPLRRAVRQTVGRVQPVAAKRLLDAVRPAVEQEPDGLGWLGDCFQVCGFATDATACYEKATTARTATSDDWLRKAVRTAEAGDADAAAKVIADAKAKLNSPQLYLMTAALFAEHPAAPKKWAPDLPAAADKKLYAQARLAVKLSKFDRTEAVGVLEDYLADKEVPADGTAWARRNLAMLLAARGTGTDRARAKELLTDTDKAGDTADEKRSTAAILAQLSRQLERGDRDEVLARAIGVLTEVSGETKNPRDKFLLAQLYRTAAVRADEKTAFENRKKARLLLIELMKADPKNTEYRIAALEDATDPDDQKFAEESAATLIKYFPADYRVVQAVARYECRVGKPEQALGHALAYARTADSTPGDLQVRSARSAELLDELARRPGVRGTPVGRKMTDAAVEKYEALYVVRPEAIVALVGLLASDGRAEAGFAEIEKAAAKLPSRVKLLAGLAMLRTGAATDAQFKMVNGWLTAASEEEPGSSAVLLNAGEFHILRRDLAEAEKAYKTVLASDEQNVVALSNLAWLLSSNPDAAERAVEMVDRAVRVVGLTGELLDTRARVKIARKEYAAAEQDLEGALKQEQTALRLFHLALAEHLQGPTKADDAGKHFREAKEKGLRAVTVHPADRDTFTEFEKKYGK